MRETQRLTPPAGYTTALQDFFQWEIRSVVSPELIAFFLALSEYEAIRRVLAYRAQLLAAGLSAATLNSWLARLRSFFTHAYKRGLCRFYLDDIKSLKAQNYNDTRGILIGVPLWLLNGMTLEQRGDFYQTEQVWSLR
jgi:hypothetical protein